MIVVMHEDAPTEAVNRVVSWLTNAGLDVHRLSATPVREGGTTSPAAVRLSLGVTGPVDSDTMNVVREFEGVSKVIRVSEPFRLASRHFRSAPTVLSGNFGTIGGTRPWIAIEPVGLRSNDGPAEIGDASLYRLPAGRPFDAAVTRTKISPESVGALTCVSIHAAPQAQRVPLIFVTRVPSVGADSWISRAEKELRRSENSVVLLEAGGEYPSGARTLEVAAIARAKARTHLPIVVDVPVIAEQARYSLAVAAAALGAGADGVILRVWMGPPSVTCRTPATLPWDEAVEIAGKLRAVAEALRGGGHDGRSI